ncbi:polysaccharide biosynthesis/export family protein [Geminicoccaceae bacterium 1502E]|nr:polysaccharide biosynthesis/export family protein [Geminicoccaceae bacterium 1502E]
MNGLATVRHAIVALLLTFVAACGGGPTGGASDTPVLLETPEYTLASGDRLRVNVFRHEDLSGEFALDGAGNFAMPLVGTIKAYGLTTRDLEQRIAERLGDGYLVDPQVSIEVLNYRPFYILGEVNKPGQYEFVNGMTVLQAVTIAGGFTYRAQQEGVILKRGGANQAGVTVAPTQAVLPGDVIVVEERFF